MRLLDILDSHQAAQLEFVIDHQHLLNAVFVQQCLYLLVICIFLYSDQPVLGCHDIFYRIAVVCFKAQITAGNNTQQLFTFNHRHT